MGWVKISCAERETLKADHDWVPVASCTDLDAEFHSEPEVFTEWGDRSTGRPALRDYRYPPRYHSGESGYGKSDRKPCEHYRWGAGNGE